VMIMKKKNNDGFMKYFIRGVVAALIMWIITLPLSFLIGFITLGNVVIGGILIVVYFIMLFPLSGYIMTRVVKDWVK